MNRRQFVGAGLAFGAAVQGRGQGTSPSWVNDVHAELNRTRVRSVETLESLKQFSSVLENDALSMCGARHSMGGQQFGSDTTLVDFRKLNRFLSLDAERGLATVEAGITWPTLQKALMAAQPDADNPWSIIQKQTGADELTIGGAVSSNIHGRGLALQPFVGDVESLTLFQADGSSIICSRTSHPALFSAVLGGYGMFGLIYSVTLRLQRRYKLKRIVALSRIDELADRVTARIADGFGYGDLQFCTAPDHPDFLRKGLFSCYQRAPDEAPIPADRREMNPTEWAGFYHLAHLQKPEAYKRYVQYYQSTDGQHYLSDEHQFGVYLPGFHNVFNQQQGYKDKRSLMISELYVPRARLAAFMEAARASALRLNMDIIYGTIRFIRKDDVTMLNWAREDFACIVLNLRVTHTEEGLALARRQFVQLIDHAIGEGGSFYLTYHRWARKDQVEACYPRMREWMALKAISDPKEQFTSDWYRHMKTLLG